MEHAEHKNSHLDTASRRLGLALCLLLTVGFVTAASASASYEQVADFGKNEQLEATGLAVNTTGAGGVPPGTVYAVGIKGRRVIRYSPSGEFREAWGWGVGDGEVEFQRCGPDGDPAYPTCLSVAGELNPPLGEGPGQFGIPMGVAVEQSTGRVYVLDNFRKSGVVQVFSPDGSELLESFGQRGAAGESFDEGPGKIHTAGRASGIAVSNGSVVYLTDYKPPSAKSGVEERVMVFDDGVYTGRDHDIAPYPQGPNYIPTGLAVDNANNLYTHSEDAIYEFSPADRLTPICEFQFSAGGITGMGVDPATGAPFFYSSKGKKEIHQLSPCNSEGQFEEVGTIPVSPKPGAGETVPLAFNPILSYEEGRPPGILYAADGSSRPEELGIGHIFAQPVSLLPEIEAQSVSGAGESSALLEAEINPNGEDTSYAFQYLSEAAYQANEPNERQAVTVSATGGTFTLGFGGQETGGTAKGNLAAGSTTVESLITAEGKGNLSAATGTGTITAGSTEVKALATTTGAFAVGQTLASTGSISGGIKIIAVTATTLTLSKPAKASAAGVALKAGATEITGLSTTFGRFVVGQPIAGSGLPPATTILAVSPTSLTLSEPVETNATGVALNSGGPLPLAVGQQISGPGIPVGATITEAAKGTLTLSHAASASTTGAALRAGIPFDATAGGVGRALRSLSSIGGVGGSVQVTGGPGDEAGSSPYEIVFTGTLENRDLPELSSDSSDLSGGAASATLATQHDGGGGFAAGASEVPSGGAQLGSGLTTLAVSAALSGLDPDTDYRFRVVATNVEGKTEGEARSFRTYPITPSGLPDGRAYELVTPVEKHGGEPFPLSPELGSCGRECKPGVNSEAFPRQISADGEAVVYSGFSFSFEEGASVYNEYLSKRTSTGWQTTNLSPALMGSTDQGYRAFSADLSQGVLYQRTPTLTPSAPPGYANLYRQPSADPGALETLLTSAPLNRPEGFFSIAYAGASKDFNHHFFAANDALEGSVPPAVDGGASKRNLYEYDGGTLRLVNVLPDETSVPGAFFGSKSQEQGETLNLSHAISDDGSRVFWSSESGQVYVRKDGSSTEEIPDASGKFLTASADGSKVLLTNGLLYDVEDLAAPAIDLSEGEGGFLGITGQSEDLSKIYFVDTAVLDEAPNDQGAVAQAGQANLYAWEEGGAVRYVATLVHVPGADDSQGGGATSGTWTASPANRLAQASPDGRWLAFRSEAALIDGFENVGPCELIELPGSITFNVSACAEVYLYDSATEELICPSCNPSGEAPHGPSTLPLLSPVPGELDPQPQPRFLSNSGRLYFDSQDALTPRDTNENIEDAYQYEPQGIGDCKREGGCVSLISAGREPGDSNFLAADPSGENVFFTTRDQLLLEDRDKLVDVYVAREGGGFPTTAQSGGGECQGEACQPAPIVPAYPTPASGFTGAGNLKQGPTSKRCPKAKRKVRRKGKTRCVNANRKRQGKKAQARHNQGGGR